MTILYGAILSPFVRKTRVALALKNLPYDSVPSLPYSGDEALKKVSPLEKIPALVDGDLTINDSKVICRYLENAYPEVPIYPTDAAQKARADWFEEYGGSVVAEAAGGLFFHRFLRVVIQKKEVNQEAVDIILNEKMPKVLDYLESQLPEEGFLFGEMGIADVALVSPFLNAGYTGFGVDEKSHPKVAGLIERVKAHPAVAPILAEEAALLGR